jgi:hypothetical protein
VASSSAIETVSDTLPAYTLNKYQPLFRDMFTDAARFGELQQLLIGRERIAVAINTIRQASDEEQRRKLPQQELALAESDAKIRDVLHPSDYWKFEVLKDSDIEQFQIDDYAGGMSNVAPLSDEGRATILQIKLKYKQRFRQVLNDSHLFTDELTADQRRYAFQQVRQALEEYRINYLQEVQYLVNEQQYALLSNYETSEFDAELEKLRGIANGS